MKGELRTPLLSQNASTGITALKLLSRATTVAGLLSIAGLAAINLNSVTVRRSTGHSLIATDTTLAVCAAVGLGLGLVLGWAYRRLDFGDWYESPHLFQADEVDLGQIEAQYQAIASSMTAVEKSVLVRTAMGLQGYTSRAIDEIELQDTMYTRTINKTIEVPLVEGAVGIATSLYFPLIRSLKGRLIDDLKVQVNHVPAETRPFRENLILSIILLAELFRDSFKTEASAIANADIFEALIKEVAHQNPRSMPSLPEAELLLLHAWLGDGAISKPETAEDGPKYLLGDRQRHFLSMLNYLLDYYFVFVRVDARTGASVNVEYTYTEARPNVVYGLSNRSRRWLGLPYYRFSVPIPLALDCYSYHFRAPAPEGTYLHVAAPRLKRRRRIHEFDVGADRTSALEIVARTQESTAAQFSPNGWFSPTYGTPTVHFYGRALSSRLEMRSGENAESRSQRLSGFYLDLYFRPVPPGISGPVVVLSIYLAVITTAIAYGNHHVFEKTGGTSSILGVVLGLPALMSAWVASRFDQKGLRQATPLMLLELFSLLTISLLAVGVAAFKASSTTPESVARFHHFFILTGHEWWALVWVLSLGQAIISVVAVIIRLARYGRALRRSAELRERYGVAA